jgi:hypothetical protein
MTTQQQIQKILQRFPTEKYKQFSHQTRPFFTLATAICLIALGWFHVVNFMVVSWILAAFVLDNIALTPIMSALRAVNHLVNRRKTFKSIMTLLVVALSAGLGVGLGYFLLGHFPIVASIFTDYISLTGCSPFLISMGAMLGAYIAHATHKVSLFWGIFIGSFLATMLYIPVPIALEVIYFSAVGTAFFATVLAKQSLRLYYKLNYGHTNADGYGLDRNAQEQREFALEQSKKFGITLREFEVLSYYCLARITEVKKDASIWTEYMNYRSQITNSYKDIQFALMNPNITEEEIRETKYLIAHSNLTPAFNTAENKNKVASMYRLGTFFAPDLELRTMAHQFKISESGILDPKVQAPFRRALR